MRSVLLAIVITEHLGIIQVKGVVQLTSFRLIDIPMNWARSLLGISRYASYRFSCVENMITVYPYISQEMFNYSCHHSIMLRH
jgi:hypothetical protein